MAWWLQPSLAWDDRLHAERLCLLTLLCFAWLLICFIQDHITLRVHKQQVDHNLSFLKGTSEVELISRFNIRKSVCTIAFLISFSAEYLLKVCYYRMSSNILSADHVPWFLREELFCESRFCFLFLTRDALRFTCSVWLWYPEGVTISVWGDSEGSTAHSRRQAKTDRSNKKQCITSYQSLNQPPHIHPFFSPSPSIHPSLDASISLSPSTLLLYFSVRSPSFFPPLFNILPSLTSKSYRSCPFLYRGLCHLLGIHPSIFTHHYTSL